MSGSRAARKEVSEWLKGQASEAGDEVARLEIDHVKENERCIVLKTVKGEAFSITYQTDYPSSSDEYLFLETESKVVDFVAVINDLRDFVYGQPPSLTLSALLDQLKRYLMKKAQKAKGGGVPGLSRGGGARGKADIHYLSGGDEGGWSDGGGAGSELFSNDQGDGSGGGDDHDNDYADEGDDEDNDADDAYVDEDEGNESDYVYEEDDDETGGGGTGGSESTVGQVGSTWLDEHYKKRTWQSKERELRKEMAANKERKAKAKEDANKRGGKKKVENIFTSWASSAVLTQDLLDIQRLEHELGMEVEAVEDNIFHWKVKINKVSESSPLAEDLRRLRKTYAYGYVEMELNFTMDLYPFYPPLVKLVRPRFQGFMMGRITSLEMLQLSKWSSVRGMKGVLIGIRTALETWGRLDLDSELNDMIFHPEGSYTELEHLLMRLGLVTEIRPHGSEAFDEDALWEAVDMREEAQEKAHRLGSSTSNHARQSSEGSSVERKRKRSGPAAAAAAAAAAKDSTSASSSAGAAALEDGRGNPESVVAQTKGVKGAAGVAIEAAEGGEDALNGASQGKKAGINVAQKIWAEVKGQKATSATGSAPLAKDSDQLLGSLLEDLRATTAKAGANAQDGSGARGNASLKLKAFLAASGKGGGGGGGEGNEEGGSGFGVEIGGVAKGSIGADMKGLTSTKKRQQYWAAGTGYGHSGSAGEKWDVEAYLAAQREQDRLKEDLLQEIAYLMRPDERHTFPEHITCGGSSNSSGLDEDSWSRTSPPNATVSSASDVAPHSGPRNKGSNGFGGDALAKGRGKGNEKVTATSDTPVPGAGFNAVSTVSAATATAEIYDLSGRRRKKLTYSQEIYRVETVKSSLRVLEESCLVPFLQQLLENDSLLDVDRHASLYTSVFKVVRCITAWRSLHPLLCPMKGQPPGKSLYRLLSRLGDRAKIYRSTTAKGTSGRKSATPQQNLVNASTKKGLRRGGTSGRGTTGTGSGEGSTSCAGDGTKEDDHSALTDLLLSAVREVDEVVDASFVEKLERASITRPAEASSTSRSSGKMAASTGVVGGSTKGRGRAGRSRGGGGCSREGRGVQKGIEGDDDARRYRESMAPLQYVELEDLEGFLYRSESANTSNRGNPQRVKRLGQEHADLSQSLPLSLSSSVFVRTHEDQMDWMQVMISGPDDTPYSGGLFAFDIFFPQNYPQCPPKVKLVTTGGGQHRFNPNLYADGKVCLSLLGTWDGDRGESWNSQTSTLLQVLVSIQSLILVPEPFFNEPGYERQLGTETGKSQSWDYNARQREGTLRLAMLDMIQRPPKGFEEVVNRHFYLRRSYLEGLLNRYVKEAKEKEKKDSKRVCAGHLSRLQGLASKLKEKLASIPPPPV